MNAIDLLFLQRFPRERTEYRNFPNHHISWMHYVVFLMVFRLHLDPSESAYSTTAVDSVREPQVLRVG